MQAQSFFYKKKQQLKKNQFRLLKKIFRNERSNSLLQRFATTDEVATTIAYLCSPLSSATNGTIVKVDGGSSGGI
ncbi:SDR family oxidoreductase [Flavobacteriaceae bacterium]|nr:SDR family oxidoreductase [Flavobacteriaceae bacterium]